MSKTRVSVLTLLALCAVTAQAIVYIVPSDRELVNSSNAIVIGTAIASHAEATASNGIVTVAEFRVERILKGSVDSDTIRIVEPGGFMTDRSTLIPGSPRYDDGARYLVMLAQWPDGSWRTNGWQLGQFRLTTDLHGARYFSRGDDEMIFGLDARDGSQYVDQFREADGFARFIEALSGDPNAPASEAYFVSRSDVMLARSLQPQRKLIIAPNFSRYSYLYSGNFRWQNGGKANFKYCCVGNPYPTTIGANTVNATGAASAAVTRWNIAGTSIGYAMSSTPEAPPGATGCPSGSTATPGCGGLSNADGMNTILFNDPNNYLGSAPAGVVAVGGITTSGGGYTAADDGLTYSNPVEVDVVVNKNSKLPTFIDQNLLTALLTHEVGHTLGFRHSDGTASPTSPPPACDATVSDCASPGNAVMAHVVQAPALSLQTWDRNAAQTVYGSGPVCTPPSVTTQPQSQTINSGQSATLSVTASGSGPLTYQWFKGASGDTTTPVGTNASTFNTGALTATTQFWVRVTGQCAPVANSATATITIACTPVITAQPSDQQVTSGGTATLTVAFTSATSTTVTWYRGIAADTSNPVGNGTSFTTPAISSPANFWAQLTNACGTTNTRTVNITLAASCIAPANPAASASATSVNAGQPVSLQVIVSGTNLVYQWFRGVAPDQSNPIQGATTFSITDTPAGTTANYWVKVTNACGTAISNTVTVNVIGAPACTAPAITTQPEGSTIAAGTAATLSVAASGTNLHYAWFEGNAGDTSKPFGSDASSVTTRALTGDQSFWVKVSNDCGSAQSATVLVIVKPGRHRSVKH